MTINASFGGLRASQQVSVVAETLSVATMHLTFDGLTGISSTANARTGTARALRGQPLTPPSSNVRMTFTDGSQFDSVGSLAPWLTLEDLVTYDSQVPAAINVSDAGVITVNNNFHQLVEVQASLSCRSAVASLWNIAANLRAGSYDVGAQLYHAS